MLRKYFLYFSLATLLSLGAILGTEVFARPYVFQGSLIDPAVPAQDFTLIDQYGQPFELGDQRGKVILMFFGYTHCPDVCPLTLADFKQIKSRLGEAAEHVRFVFITVDPGRDTRERIKEYLSNFDPEIVGLTGEGHALEHVWQDYGVYQAHDEPDDHDNDSVEHSTRVYAIDKRGNLRVTYPFGMEREKIYQDVYHLVRE